MKLLIGILLLVTSMSAYASERIYVQFEDYCDIYELDLHADGNITGGEIGCQAYGMTYVTGTYGKLGAGGYTKDNLVMLLTFKNNDNTFVDLLSPVEGISLFYRMGEAPLTTTYTITPTLGNSTISRTRVIVQ